MISQRQFVRSFVTGTLLAGHPRTHTRISVYDGCCTLPSAPRNNEQGLAPYLRRRWDFRGSWRCVWFRMLQEETVDRGVSLVLRRAAAIPRDSRTSSPNLFCFCSIKKTWWSQYLAVTTHDLQNTGSIRKAVAKILNTRTRINSYIRQWDVPVL